jgi:hypothetical protein
VGLGVPWLDGPLGLVCLLIGLYHVGLLVAGRAPVAPALSHAVMGVGMAAMFVPAADPVPRPLWVALFVVVGAWFGAAAIRGGTLTGEAGHHVVGAAAMLFMLIGHRHGSAGTPGAVNPEHAHHAGAGGGSPSLLLTAVALGFTAWFLADLVRRFTHLTPAPAAVPVAAPVAAGVATPLDSAPAPVLLPPHAVPHLVMSAAMAVMLLGMA